MKKSYIIYGTTGVEKTAVEGAFGQQRFPLWELVLGYASISSYPRGQRYGDL